MSIDSAIAANRNEWIVYADNVLKLDYDEIADKVKLASSTVRNYIRKFAHLLTRACEIFDRLYFRPQPKKASECISSAVALDNVGQQCYLVRFYDKENRLVCSKVGTTTRKVQRRIMEELRSKTYANCVRAEVQRVYHCGEYPAEGLESRIRAEYIKRYPQAFKKNDRFIETEFDLELIDSIVENYFK